MDGIELEFSDEALDYIVKKALGKIKERVRSLCEEI